GVFPLRGRCLRRSGDGHHPRQGGAIVVSVIERIIPNIRDLRAEPPLGVANNLLQWRLSEKGHLDKIHKYWVGEQQHPFAPAVAPSDVVKLARMSRVNILDIVVASVAQTLYVDGYRQDREGDDAPAWAVWQANELDAEQSGVHEAALAYGCS